MTRRGIRRLAALAGIVTIVAAGLAVWFIVDSSARQKQTEEAYAQGMIHYESGRAIERHHDELREQGLEIDDDLDPDDDYALAFPYLGDAIARIKDDPELLKAYAACRFAVEAPNGKHVPRAIGAAEAAVSLAPTDPEAKQILLKLYWKAPYLTELVDLAGRMLESDPSLYVARIWRIESLQRLGRDEEAMADANALVERFPDRLTVHIKWDAIAKRNGFSALDRVDHARNIRPRFADDPVYLGWLSQIESVAGNTEESVAAARAAALLEPVTSEQVSSLVAWLRDLHGTLIERATDTPLAQPSLLELAEELFARALDNPELGSSVAAQAARREWWANRTDEARAFAARIGPDSKEADAFWAGLVLIGEQPSLGAPIESESVAPLAGAISNDDLRLLLESMDRLRKGAHETVAKTLASFVAEDPGMQPVADYIRGIALYRMSDYRGASIALRAAAEDTILPRDRAWKALGDTFAAKGNLDAASFAYEGMASRGLNDALNTIDVTLKLAEQESDPRIAAQAIESLRVVLDETDSNPMIQVRLARAMILGGETPAGIELARTLLNADPPPDPVGTVNLIRALRLYAPELGEEMLASMSGRTDSIEVLAEQAVTLARDDKLDEARAMLEAQIEERTPEAALPYRRALLRVLDQFNAEDATAVAASLSDDYPESGTAQLSVLRTKAIWQDLEAAWNAINRLRELMGEQSLAWLTYAARATIEGDPSEEALRQLLVNSDPAGVDLDDILREAPNDFDALVLSARASRMLAERLAENARRDEASFWVNRAASYYSLAAGPGVRAAAFKPYIEMLNEYGRTLDAQNALDRFAALTRINSKETLYDRRNLLLNAGRFSEAARDQRQLAGYATPESVLGLADMHIRAGESREAIEVIDEFLAEQEWDADLLEAAADRLIDAGAVARALEVFGQLPDPHDGLPRDAVIARALTRSGRPQDALPYQTAAAQQLGTVEAWLAAIRLASSIGDDDVLSSTVRRASEALPDAPEIAAYSDTNSLRVYSLAIVSRAEPSDSPAMADFIASALAHGRGEISDAEFLDRLESMCSANPELLQAWRARIEFSIQLGRIAEAIQIAREAAEAQPDSPGAVRLLVEALRGEGRSAEAIEPAERLVSMSGADPYRATSTLGILEADIGNYARAINLLSAYRDRLQNDSAVDPEPGLTALAVAFAGTGNPLEAASLFASRLDPGSLKWQNTAMLATEALPGTQPEARREWLGMITDDVFAMRRAGQYTVLARYSGNPSDAKRALDIVDAAGNPDSADWLWFRAQASMFAGQLEDAETGFVRIMDLEPTSPLVPAALGELLSRQRGRESDALTMLDRATDLTDTSNTGLITEIRISEARALLGLGRAQEALDTLQSVLAREDPAVSALIVAGNSYLELGSQNQAIDYEERARRITDLDAQTRSELDLLSDAIR